LIAGAAFCPACGSFVDEDRKATIDYGKKATAHSEAVDMAIAGDRPVRLIIAALVGVAALAVTVLFISLADSKTGPANVVNSPLYREAEAPGAHTTVETKHVALPTAEAPKVEQENAADSPSGLDNKIAEDGRTYSVALVAASPDIPVGAQIFAQGDIVRFGYANVRSRPYAILADEFERDRNCFVCDGTRRGRGSLLPLPRR
jgi:hypothetical protein